ncbi:MAG: RNA polymerase II mediator complex subunit [Bogoriella megaspora]|nr:MAG: RNA polymerase II mediator complex subunit [Bogoriella megaspora]
MADRLTQLQDCLDQLLTQMYASLRYIQTHHAYLPIPTQPSMNPHTSQPPEGSSTSNGHAEAPTEDTGGLRPDPPQVFNAALKELAQDMVLKEQQIEYLIDVLPGIGRSEEEQRGRIRELEGRLKEVEGRRKEAVREREGLVERVEEVVGRVRRV